MKLRATVRKAWEPALWFLGLLLIWEAAVRIFAIPGFILPAPSVFMLRIVQSAPQLAYHGMITTKLPLMLVWFGFADFPKILLTGLITFFPVMVDSVAGFQSIDPRKYYLSKSTGASWLQTFVKIELPSAAPQIFSGLRISIVVAVTVVIVVEWLNSKTGLGYLVLRSMDGKDTSMIFATLVVGSLIGVFLSGLVQAIERALVPQGRH